MFAWTAKRFMAETEAHARKSALISRCSSGADVAGFFQRVTPIAVDVSHLERSKKSRLSRDGFRGTYVGRGPRWPGWSVGPPRANVVVGRARTRETSNSIVWAEDGPVVLVRSG